MATMIMEIRHVLHAPSIALLVKITFNVVLVKLLTDELLIKNTLNVNAKMDISMWLIEHNVIHALKNSIFSIVQCKEFVFALLVMFNKMEYVTY